MRQINIFSDTRHDYHCSYCGNGTDEETRDHVPSKVLLNKPFPENLPVVMACYDCNQDFSLDEEYFACMIECVKYGTTEIEKLNREKIKQILKKNPLLKKRIEESRIEHEGKISFKIEPERFKKVIIKLAKGHIKYEFSQPQINEPNQIVYVPITNLDQEELDSFLAIENFSMDVVPEIGSRAFNKFFAMSDGTILQQKWIEVQKGNYSYITEEFSNGKKVKLIISEFLAVEVIWINQ